MRPRTDLAFRQAELVVTRVRTIPARERALALWQVVSGVEASGVDLQAKIPGLFAAADLRDDAVALRRRLGLDLSDTKDEISGLYGALRASASDDARFSGLLGRLRDLQAAEARQMAEVFAERRVLRAGEVASAVRRADVLLAEHEDSSS